MTRAQVIEEARRRGFTHALTYAGAIPLATWTPYGSAGWRGEFVGPDRVRDLPPLGRSSVSGALGVWTLTVDDFARVVAP
jgi:hypothetical protein